MIEQPIDFSLNIHKKLNLDDENRKFFMREIKEKLQVDVLPEHIIHDIHTYCEFDVILAAIEGCFWITEHPKKDQKHEYRKKERFLKAQATFINELKSIGQTNNARQIIEMKYEPHIRISTTYEDALKLCKQILYDQLIIDCGTGQTRAKNIIKILEEI